MESPGLDGRRELYFQTDDVQPDQLTKELDEICGKKGYDLRMVEVGRWILIPTKRLTKDEENKIRQLALGSESNAVSPHVVGTMGSTGNVHFKPIARARTAMSSRRSQNRAESTFATVASFVNRLLGRKKEEAEVRSRRQQAGPPSTGPSLPTRAATENILGKS